MRPTACSSDRTGFVDSYPFRKVRGIHGAPRTYGQSQSVVFDCAALIARNMEDVENLNDAPLLAVVDQIIASQKTKDTGRNFVAFPAHIRIVAQQDKPFLDGINEPVGNIKVGAPSPLDEDLIQFSFGLFCYME